MYRTPNGERILLGAERQLFEASLAMMVDFLSDGDFEFGVQVFDDLQRGQKLFALYRVARALLQPDEPAPEHTAFAEGTVASVYRHVFDRVVQEVDDPDFAPSRPSWRKLVIEAAQESDSIDQVPKETSRNKEDWEIVVDCLADDVLRDRDFELEIHLDADPDSGRQLQDFQRAPRALYHSFDDGCILTCNTWSSRRGSPSRGGFAGTVAGRKASYGSDRVKWSRNGP